VTKHKTKKTLLNFLKKNTQQKKLKPYLHFEVQLHSQAIKFGDEKCAPITPNHYFTIPFLFFNF